MTPPSDVDSGYLSDASSQQELLERILVPLPFSKNCTANTVDFGSGDRSGVCLADWARLYDKGKSRTCLDDPEETLDELILGSSILYQCQASSARTITAWPGYATHTRFIALPDNVAEGRDVMRKVDLLDLVCTTLTDWLVTTMNSRHIICRDPTWAIGLEQISFKHIYVLGAAEVKGYLTKWVPVLAIDACASRTPHENTCRSP
ncbi:hypothetical protein BD413DRAFT_464049 [Trametes elegans]|nr:hypothetical protein BD413DRAFT_464049 [Trametes elegans]